MNHRSTGTASHDSLSPSLRAVCSEQQQLGRNHLLKGRLTKSWAPLQQAYFHQQYTRHQGSTWASDLADSGHLGPLLVIMGNPQ
jgi:hypothetical protein